MMGVRRVDMGKGRRGVVVLMEFITHIVNKSILLMGMEL